MDLYAINGDLLYSGKQYGLKKTLEQAVLEGVDLSGITLRRARLRGAHLDGMKAPLACLWGADLTGCNLAGADLREADIRMATLTDCCLAEATCHQARFEGAYFRNTLLQEADFSRCAFSCPSILQQPLHLCASLVGAVYWHRGEEPCDLSLGVTRLEMAGHTIVGLNQRLLVNGTLHHEKILDAQNTTKNSINLPFFAE